MRLTVADSVVIFGTSTKWRADSAGKKTNRKALGQAFAAHKIKNRKLKYGSISHTVHIGGWALSDHPVGFDLELAGRAVSGKAVRWFAGASEVKKVKAPLILWVMKEAAYKAMRGPLQPKTVRQIEIVHTRRLSQNENIQFLFRVKNGRRVVARGEGLIKRSPRTIMGIALFLT